MEITHGSQITFTDPAAKHRPGGIAFKILSKGKEGTLENYVFELARQTGFFSPRHRHNFDQFRYAVRGDFSLAPGVTLKEGCLSYHPEGVFYGPQDDGQEEHILLLLQFGGASGQGFLSLDQIKAANNELIKAGKFDKGKYYPQNNGQGIEPVDGFEAAWSFANNRKLEYPLPRYDAPILMNPENFAWRRCGENVFDKTLGVFSERRAMVRMIRVQDGGQLAISQGSESATQLVFVLKGKGLVNEDEPVYQESTLRLLPEASCTIRSQEVGGLELLHFVIPTL